MARRLWSKSDNPPKWVSDQLNLSHWVFSDALHKIKEAEGLRGADSVHIYDDGDVTDDGGELIGNIYDEI
jgi:hypothetical protein